MTRPTPASKSARDAYETALHRINNVAAARLYWERHLRKDEQAKLGKSFPAAIEEHQSCVGFLLGLDAQITGEQAVIDVAHELGFLSSEDREWLLREIVGHGQTRKNRVRPVWNRDQGKLTYQQSVIRRVRITVGARIVAILNRFEAAHWPDRIDSPFRDEMMHRDAIKSLNLRLTRIRFFSDGTGRGICWEVYQPSSDAPPH